MKPGLVLQRCWIGKTVQEKPTSREVLVRKVNRKPNPGWVQIKMLTFSIFICACQALSQGDGYGTRPIELQASLPDVEDEIFSCRICET